MIFRRLFGGDDEAANLRKSLRELEGRRQQNQQQIMSLQERVRNLTERMKAVRISRQEKVLLARDLESVLDQLDRKMQLDAYLYREQKRLQNLLDKLDIVNINDKMPDVVEVEDVIDQLQEGYKAQKERNEAMQKGEEIDFMDAQPQDIAGRDVQEDRLPQQDDRTDEEIEAVMKRALRQLEE